MELEKNAFKAALARGERQIGLWSSLCSPIVADVLSDSGYDSVTGDNEVWSSMKNDGTSSYPVLGNYYRWTNGPTAGGGKLSFHGSDGTPLVRDSSTMNKPARWSR